MTHSCAILHALTAIIWATPRRFCARGSNTGGRCYGYDNVPIEEGGRRAHVDYKINEGEAAIVREVFELRASGHGYRPIAKDLNRRRITAPRAGKRGSGSWAPGMIREMLLRERYAGVQVWGKAAKAYRGGTKVRLVRADDECIRMIREELRIIPEDLWTRVQATMRVRETPWKAGAVGRVPKHLLAGLGRCAECGGSMLVMSAKHGTETMKLYGCSHNHNRGETPTIAAVIGEREKRLTEVRARLEVLDVAPGVLDLEVRRLEKEARARLRDFQGLLTRNVIEGRKTLEALLEGPLRFTPVQTKDGRRYEITGAAAVGAFCTTDCVPKGNRTVVNLEDFPAISFAVVA